MWLKFNHRSGAQVEVGKEFFKEMTIRYAQMFVASQPERAVCEHFKVKAFLPDWVVKDDSVLYSHGSFFAIPGPPVVDL